MATEGRTSEGPHIGVEGALNTMLAVLRMLDEQWDSMDDHSRRATVRLTVETAQEQWSRVAERGLPD